MRSYHYVVLVGARPSFNKRTASTQKMAKKLFQEARKEHPRSDISLLVFGSSWLGLFDGLWDYCSHTKKTTKRRLKDLRI